MYYVNNHTSRKKYILILRSTYTKQFVATPYVKGGVFTSPGGALFVPM